MYVGISKNIGGIRVGFGERINTKPSAKEVKNAEFKDFLRKMGNKSLDAVRDFVNTTGYDFDELRKYTIDLDTLFEGNKKYEELIVMAENMEKIVERLIEIEDFGITAKRKVSNEVYKIEDFVKDYVKNYSQYLEQGLATRSIRVDYSTLEFTPEEIERQENEALMMKKEARKKKLIKFSLNCLLVIGILRFPYIFAWITLLKGYSKTAKIMAFSYMILFAIVYYNGTKELKNENNTNPIVQESSKWDYF